MLTVSHGQTRRGSGAVYNIPTEHSFVGLFIPSVISFYRSRCDNVVTKFALISFKRRLTSNWQNIRWYCLEKWYFSFFRAIVKQRFYSHLALLISTVVQSKIIATGTGIVLCYLNHLLVTQTFLDIKLPNSFCQVDIHYTQCGWGTVIYFVLNIPTVVTLLWSCNSGLSPLMNIPF